jgi:hypothetical protein
MAFALTLGAGVLPLAAQQAAPARAADPDRAVQGGALPAGWSARADRNASTDNVQVTAAGADGMTVKTGPAVILWRAADRAPGGAHVIATFDQLKAPAHPEAYGLFVGGQALEGEGQKYTYFLIRGDGKFLIKSRDGASASNVTPQWAAHPAIKAADAGGKASNTLEIDSKQNPAKVVFKVNGQTVHEADAKSVDSKGIAGLRINHNLDVAVKGFGVHK